MFVHARILQQLGYARLAQFLDTFEPDLKAMNLFAPPALPATHFYFQEIADFFVNTENLPVRLLDVMSTIEPAAAPEHFEPLNSLIQSHVPDCTESHPLALAMEL